ncbi:MAG: hypothetical protein WBB73_05285 [Candidatus Aminicenantaceae bacterium]
MADWIFAFFHLFLLIGVIGYAFYSIIFYGNVQRFALILVCLVIYYFFVLHKPVRQEIARRKQLRSGGDKPST